MTDKDEAQIDDLERVRFEQMLRSRASWSAWNFCSRDCSDKIENPDPLTDEMAT